MNATAGTLLFVLTGVRVRVLKANSAPFFTTRNSKRCGAPLPPPLLPNLRPKLRLRLKLRQNLSPELTFLSLLS